MSKKTKSKPLFKITDEQIEMLTSSRKNAAEKITAFLIIACHSDKTGIYSTAGIKAIRTTLHIGSDRANAIIEELIDDELIIPVDEAVGKLKDEMPIREGRSAVRWIIFPDESTDRWLPVVIVRGYGQFKSPLYTLRQSGDDAARVLLALYSHEAPVDFWGINPTTAVFVKYQETTEDEEEEDIEIENGFILKTRISKHIEVWPKFINKMQLGADDFWPALKTLEQHGFVYQALTVCTGTSVEEGIAAIYPLHTFNRYGHAPKGEESLASQMNKIAITYDRNCADADGRFYGRFAFIARGDAQAVGVYRLRFRNTSPVWDESREGWQSQQDARAHWEKEIKLQREY